MKDVTCIIIMSVLLAMGIVSFLVGIGALMYLLNLSH